MSPAPRRTLIGPVPTGRFRLELFNMDVSVLPLLLLSRRAALSFPVCSLRPAGAEEPGDERSERRRSSPEARVTLIHAVCNRGTATTGRPTGEPLNQLSRGYFLPSRRCIPPRPRRPLPPNLPLPSPARLIANRWGFTSCWLSCSPSRETCCRGRNFVAVTFLKLTHHRKLFFFTPRGLFSCFINDPDTKSNYFLSF